MKKILVTMGAWLALTCAAVGQMAPGASSVMAPIPGPAPSISQVVRSVSGPTISCFGDSECNWGNPAVPAGSTYPNGAQYGTSTQATSVLGWLQAFSNNSLYIDVTQGYPGSYQALSRVTVAVAGSGCTANTALTFTPGAATGSPANNASAVQFTADANGNIAAGQSVTYTGTNGGSGYTAFPTFTISGGSCSTAPILLGTELGTFTYGVNGDTTAGAALRIADACANAPDWMIVKVGTNDLTASTAEATIIANLNTIVSGLRACNIRVIMGGINSRTIGVGGWTQTMDKIRLRINRYESQLALQSKSAGLNPQILYYDTDHFWVDATASGGSAGNSVTAMTFDGLHPSIQGAQYEALAILNVLQPYFTGPQYQPNSQNDLYDGTNNPTGNLLGTVGLMLGTAGTTNANAGGTCAAGAIATSWQFSYSGSGTVTCSATQETTRTDGLPGQRQVITYSNATGGTTEKLTFANFVNYGTNLTKGTDQIYGTAEIDLSNVANVEYIGCQLLETATTSQSSSTLNSGNVSSSFLSVSSATFAKLVEAKPLPDFGFTASGSYRLSCRTPPITSQVGSTGYAFSIIVQGTASGVTMTFTAKVGNAAVRKVSG